MFEQTTSSLSSLVGRSADTLSIERVVTAPKAKYEVWSQVFIKEELGEVGIPLVVEFPSQLYLSIFQLQVVSSNILAAYEAPVFVTILPSGTLPDAVQ